MNRKLILAGAASVIGHREILDAFESIGFQADFIEATFHKKYGCFQNFDKTLYMDSAPADIPVIPLSEYWISQCIEKGCKNISTTALKASRSKTFFYDVLRQNNVEVPLTMEDIESAEKFIEEGNKIIVKPEGLFSGYGIKKVSKENLHELSTFTYNASHVNNNALKMFGIKSNRAIFSQSVDGEEYSADLFLNEGKISIVRICKKAVREVHFTPCTIACQLVPLGNHIRENLEKWCSILFSENDISFAQFDFIVTPAQKIIPIDFASRVGGGMLELFSCHNSNLYADAVLVKKYEIPASLTYLTQFNYLPTKSGILKTDCYTNASDGKIFTYKKKGDFVPECPSSVASRIAVLVKQNPLLSEKTPVEQFLLGDDFIEFWKKEGRSREQ